MSYWDFQKKLPKKADIKRLEKESEKLKEEVRLINEKNRLEKEITASKHIEFVEKHKGLYRLAGFGKELGKEALKKYKVIK